jgi:acyl-homoserine lactone synthase
MIQLLEAARPGENPRLEAAFRLRHSIFVDELKWSQLRRDDERDIDRFDGPYAVYFVAIEKDEVVGHLRMLPTARPHLLSDVYPHICQRNYPRGPQVWEWTRACVSRPYREGGAFGRTLAELTLAAMEWSAAHGVEYIITEWHPIWVTRFLELGAEVTPLGVPVEMDGQPVIAVQMRFPEVAFSRLREIHGTPPGIVADLPSTLPAGDARSVRGN